MAHIRNQGWPFRMTFEDFVNKYKILICPLSKNIKTHGKNCELILKKLDISEYQIGKSKVSPFTLALSARKYLLSIKPACSHSTVLD